MIELMEQTKGDLVAVKASGKLTDDDYKQTFIPALEAALAGGGQVRAVILLDESFTGWDAHAAWDDAKFGLAHRKDFSKIAMVGDSAWPKWGAKLGDHFIAGTIKAFGQDQLDQALEWVGA